MKLFQYFRSKRDLLAENASLRADIERLREQIETEKLRSWIRPSPKAPVFPEAQATQPVQVRHPVHVGRHQRAETTEFHPRPRKS